ncbi:MAG: hypothetical protein ACRDPJ_03180 [Nocardioidaceae bacterium]
MTSLTTMAPLHLGSMHAYETALVALLAFGPFVVLVFVVLLIQRRDQAEEPEPEQHEDPAASAAGPSERPR